MRVSSGLWTFIYVVGFGDFSASTERESENRAFVLVRLSRVVHCPESENSEFCFRCTSFLAQQTLCVSLLDFEASVQLVKYSAGEDLSHYVQDILRIFELCSIVHFFITMGLNQLAMSVFHLTPIFEWNIKMSSVESNHFKVNSAISGRNVTILGRKLNIAVECVQFFWTILLAWPFIEPTIWEAIFCNSVIFIAIGSLCVLMMLWIYVSLWIRF